MNSDSGHRSVYQKKAVFFDGQVNEPWAAREYGEQEMKNLDMMFAMSGPFENMKILEPGCGTGRLTRILSDKAGQAGSVAALDISPAMVDAARKRLGDRENVRVLCTGIEDFKCRCHSFDIIICHQVFPHFENKHEILKLMHEILRHEGRVIIHHFIGLREINDVHRKAGTIIQNDLMPDSVGMRTLFAETGFKVIFIQDNENGYFLKAVRP